MARASTRAVGQQAEAQALKFLQGQGLRLLDRNFHCRFGEIDLVMRDGDCVVFVEVRKRTRNKIAAATQSVGRQKQRKLTLAASFYLAGLATDALPTCRFDVIGIDTAGSHASIDWRRNAFQSE
ncbi:MAG: YraN family protein [Woeseiaceae bacterium]|nr:YraN family protein [Woeseiaceae bacterium]